MNAGPVLCDGWCLAEPPMDGARPGGGRLRDVPVPAGGVVAGADVGAGIRGEATARM